MQRVLRHASEIWKPVVGWEGLYEVSSHGRIRSLNRVIINKSGGKQSFVGRILRPARDRYGYNRVVLSKEGTSYNRIVHRLVAQAFIPNPNNLPEVNHKDEDKTNNIPENLEWCSNKYNVNYGTGLARRMVSQRNHPNESKAVRQFSKKGVVIADYPSIKEAVRRTGVKAETISKSCRGLQKFCHTYYWRFI